MSALSSDDREVLKAFLQLARTTTADVAFHELVSTARLPIPSVQRSLAKLRELGYLTELRRFGPGRRIATVTTTAERQR